MRASIVTSAGLFPVWLAGAPRDAICAEPLVENAADGIGAIGHVRLLAAPAVEPGDEVLRGAHEHDLEVRIAGVCAHRLKIRAARPKG